MGVRLILSDGQWERIAPHIIGDERTRGSNGRDSRRFVEALLWLVRTGVPWRDLPEDFGPWNSVFRRVGKELPRRRHHRHHRHHLHRFTIHDHIHRLWEEPGFDVSDG